MTRIRFGALGDYPDLLAFDEFIGDRRLNLQAGQLLVAEDGDGRAVGYLRTSPIEFLGWPLLALLCVRVDYRRRGAGQALVRAALSDGRFPRLYVTTEPENDPMLGLLRKVGAEAIGHADRLTFDGGRELLFRLK
ncbi:GNAT family N-acetyltransferase [Palleronia sp.]|uniref:GNAT family N-acetyltransferase n=1 Tax=Palleronia sp. TaxID=1940284 RepID=UPI0035C8643F